MALKKTLSFTPDGFSTPAMLQDAYCKVVQINGDKTKIFFDVVFFNKTDDCVTPALKKQYSFVPNLDGRNFIAQAYNHLKTLPEFAGATDC
jgi:hypothetical protein